MLSEAKTQIGYWSFIFLNWFWFCVGPIFAVIGSKFPQVFRGCWNEWEDHQFKPKIWGRPCATISIHLWKLEGIPLIPIGNATHWNWHWPGAVKAMFGFCSICQQPTVRSMVVKMLQPSLDLVDAFGDISHGVLIFQCLSVQSTEVLD